MFHSQSPVQPQRFSRNPGRHIRIAISVPSYPGSECQKSTWGFYRWIMPRQRNSHSLHYLGRYFPDGCFEVMQASSNFISNLRLCHSTTLCQPKGGDLGQQGLLMSLAFRGCGIAFFDLHQAIGDAPQLG